MRRSREALLSGAVWSDKAAPLLVEPLSDSVVKKVRLFLGLQ